MALVAVDICARVLDGDPVDLVVVGALDSSHRVVIALTDLGPYQVVEVGVPRPVRLACVAVELERRVVADQLALRCPGAVLQRDDSQYVVIRRKIHIRVGDPETLARAESRLRHDEELAAARVVVLDLVDCRRLRL